MGGQRERRDRPGLPGGIARGDAVAVAAWLAVLGLPVERYLTTDSHEERVVLQAIAGKTVTLVDQMQRNQATHIANAMVKARL
jgi:hypothetical protein